REDRAEAVAEEGERRVPPRGEGFEYARDRDLDVDDRVLAMALSAAGQLVHEEIPARGEPPRQRLIDRSRASRVVEADEPQLGALNGPGAHERVHPSGAPGGAYLARSHG